MKFAIVILIGSLACFSLQNCDDQPEFDFVELRFVLPYSVEPNQPEFAIGDTLWLSANFPDTVYEFLSKKYIKVENYAFPTYLGFRKLISKDFDFGQIPGAASSFDVVNKIGQTTNVFETFNPIAIIYEDNTYKCLIGIVPKQKGIFCLNFLSPKSDVIDFSSIDLGVNEDGVKRKGYYTQFYYVVNNGNNNLDLLRANCKLHSDTDTLSSNVYYEQKGTFTFEVK